MNRLLRVVSLSILCLVGGTQWRGSAASDGSLDPTFGQNGIALAAPGQWDHIAGNALGAFAVAGPCLGDEVGTNPCFQVADSDGHPNPAFNGGSSVTLTNPPCDLYQFQIQGFFKLLLDGQGRIVVVADCITYETMFALRFDASGQRDLTFGENGYEMFPDCPGQSYSYESAIDHSDRLVVLLQCGQVQNTVVTRRNADGSLDTTFGDAGYAATSFTTTDDRFEGGGGLGSFALDRDDRTLLAGVCGPGSAPYHCVARLDDNGHLDPTFGTEGLAAQPTVDGLLNSLALSTDSIGRVLAAATYESGNQYALAVTRLDVSGAVDISFGEQGVAQAAFGRQCWQLGFFVDSSARSVIHASCTLGVGTIETELVGRLTESGAIDDAFGSNGTVTMPLDPFNTIAVSSPLDEGGRYLLPGTCATPASACVIRLWNDAIFHGRFDL